MKRKELTKTFMMILKLILKLFGLHDLYNNISAV